MAHVPSMFWYTSGDARSIDRNVTLSVAFVLALSHEYFEADDMYWMREDGDKVTALLSCPETRR